MTTTTWTTNLLTNGSFETGNPPTGWLLTGSGATFVRSTEQVQAACGSYSGKLTRVGNDCSISQTLNTRYYSGYTLGFGCWVYATVANVARIRIYDDINGNEVSIYHSGIAGWEWLSVSNTTGTDAEEITCYLEVLNTDSFVYFDEAILFPGGLIPVFGDSNDLVMADGRISNIVVTAGGAGYSSNPTITISAPTAPESSSCIFRHVRQATATATVVAGVITAITLDDVGAGYDVDVNTDSLNPYPTIIITDSTGSGASAICYVPTGLPQEPWTHSDYSTFCITQDQTVKAWGYGGDYHLGQGETNATCTNPNSVTYNNITTTRVRPVRIIECYNNVFILDSLGRVWGVGNNDQYELGLNDTTYRPVFTMIPTSRFNNSPVVKLKCGWNQGSGWVFALTAEGKCYRWGYNNQGQLGTGNETTVQYPTELTTPVNIVDFNFMGGQSYGATMLLDSSGYVWVAGYNGSGNLSDGSTTARNTFQKYKTSLGVDLTGVSRIWGGNADGSYIVGWVLCSDGRLFGAGYNANYQLANNTTTNTNSGYCTRILKSDLTNFVADKIWFQAGSPGGSTCDCFAREAVTGDIYGWGYNANGSLGNGSTSAVQTATKLTTLCPADGVYLVKIATGHGGNVSSNFALMSDGTVYAAGSNASGVLGDGTATQRTSWTKVYLPQTDIVDIRVSSFDNMNFQVLCSDGTLYMSGYNAHSQLANGSTTARYGLGKVLF